MAAEIEMRRWQREALASWESNGRRGVVSVVTGAGKTMLALLAYRRLLEQRPDARLVVVVPTTALLDQWAVSLSTDGGVPSADVALVSGDSPRARARRATVAVINSARTRARSLVGDTPCLFVVDECHRAGSPQNAQALDVDAAWTLGLSATPRRQWDDGFERWVEPALGPIVYEYDLADARRDGLVPALELCNYRFKLDAPEQEEYERLTRRIAQRMSAAQDPGHDLALKRLLLQRSRVSAGSPARVIAAVSLAERFPQRGLIFHEQIPRAESIARLLDKRGVRVALYHSRIGAVTRRRNLELFKLGQVTKLVTCRALDEGLNVPDAEVAIIAASTTSRRQRIQRLGRVLRTTEGKQTATVCTLVGTEPEQRALEAEAAALEDVAAVRWFEIRT